jgi:hypothetical protein
LIKSPILYDSNTKDELECEGMINLIAALFRLTAQDIKLGNPEAVIFVNSEWFEEICDGIQINPDTFRSYILYNKVKSRVTYE